MTRLLMFFQTRSWLPGGGRRFPGSWLPTASRSAMAMSGSSGSRGTAPYYAYGVINDQANSDGSFVPPILENAMMGRTGLTLPVIVETSAFSSELVLCNWSTTPKTLHFFYAGDALQSEGSTAHFDLVMNAGEQRIIPNFVEWLREQNGSGIGPAGPSYAGPLFATSRSGRPRWDFHGSADFHAGWRGRIRGVLYSDTVLDLPRRRTPGSIVCGRTVKTAPTWPL